MSTEERKIFLAELDGIEATLDVLKTTCYRLREQLSVVSTTDIPSGADKVGLSRGELNQRTTKFRRTLKKTA